MTKSIALLTVSADGAHQVNLFDGVKLPPGEYVLAIDPRDAHGLVAAELQADAGRSTRHAEHCMAQFNKIGYVANPCTCDRPPELIRSIHDEKTK